MPRIFLCSATGALASDVAPVGGGVTVLEALLPYLAASDFQITVLTPGAIDERDGIRQQLAVPALSDAAPERILRLNARAYARFALEWEAALADYFADIDPYDSVVLANDTSEGPPVATLHRNGFRQMALLHVIVAEFFSRRYIAQPTGLPVRGRHLAALWRRLERFGLAQLAPDLARLVWPKEAVLAQHVEALIAPSATVARSLDACYPSAGVMQRTQIVPWGVIGAPTPSLRADRRDTLRAIGADPNRCTLLTLSRISPEKRIELVLDALRLIERQSPTTAERLQLVIAGAPAYMGGTSYHRRLQRAAAGLSRVAVHFPGYVSGDLKWRLFAAADAFCSPSYYEAYGLTIAQSLASGTPVLAAPHGGARATLESERGWIAEATPQAFAAAIRRILHADETRELTSYRAQAAAWGQRHPFDQAARRLVAIARTLAHSDAT